MYADEEKLSLTVQIRVTKNEHDLLRKERNRLWAAGRRVSMSKILCNLILQYYGEKDKDMQTVQKAEGKGQEHLHDSPAESAETEDIGEQRKKEAKENRIQKLY